MTGVPGQEVWQKGDWTTGESEVRKDGIEVPFMDGVPVLLSAELLDGIE